MREYNFDGLVGPTHNYAGLALGNTASDKHRGWVSNPRAAAQQGLEKMRHLLRLGVGQAVLPPQPRPEMATLRRLGFVGSDAQVIERAARECPEVFVRCCSASAMWTANAATVFPSLDTTDGRLHLVVANLHTLFHRQLEADTTQRVLRAIFADERHFAVYPCLPQSADFGDEGAANHTRLETKLGKLHLLAWGRSSTRAFPTPQRYPARQTLEASEAVARLAQLNEPPLLVQQAPAGIDAGAFHSDVLMVGNGSFLMLHEHAVANPKHFIETLGTRLGDELSICVANEQSLPLSHAVAAYPFNSQVVTLPDQTMAIIAPMEAEHDAPSRAFLQHVLESPNPVTRVDYLDVRQSMANGGGPACLRLRVHLSEVEKAALGARVLLDSAALDDLSRWVERHYRDRLTQADLADPQLLDETRVALDELTQQLGVGSVYDFQR